MEFDDLCIEKTQVVCHLVAALKDFRDIVKLWKGRPYIMENVEQFIVAVEVVARNLFPHKHKQSLLLLVRGSKPAAKT